MTTLSQYHKYYNTSDASIRAADLIVGTVAYGSTGKLIGTRQPYATAYDGNDYFTASKAFTTNKVTFIARVKFPAPTGNHIIFQCGYGSGSPQGYGINIFGTTGNNPAFLLQNSAGTKLVELYSSVDFFDNTFHTIWFAYDGDNGLATLLIDGVDADDTDHVSRVAPIVGVTNKALSTYRFSSYWWTGGAYLLNGSSMGSVGVASTYLTNYSDFFNSSGGPKLIDETTWTEFGGVQPYIWHKNGWMPNNLGSWGAFTAVGNPVVLGG